jgi:hypothetical protein
MYEYELRNERAELTRDWTLVLRCAARNDMVGICRFFRNGR